VKYEKISAEALQEQINANVNIRIFECLDSTNTSAKHYAEDGMPEGGLIIALSQTGGKGRMGRSFYSPENCGIYFSLILRPKIPPEDISLITPVAAVAVAKAFEDIAKKSPKIKWVNDIFVNGKKVCGILSEAAFNVDGRAEYVILGIGLNLLEPKGGYPEDIKNIAGSLFSENEDFSPNEILAAVVNNFFEFYKALKSKAVLEEYQKRMMLIGERINYTQNKIENSATVQGIDQKFRIILKNENGDLIHLSSGEVTIGSKRITV